MGKGLQSGTKVDRKRFGQEIQRFQHLLKQKKEQEYAAPGTTEELDDELDFFGYNAKLKANQQVAPSSKVIKNKKRKRKEEEKHQEEEEDEDEEEEDEEEEDGEEDDEEEDGEEDDEEEDGEEDDEEEDEDDSDEDSDEDQVTDPSLFKSDGKRIKSKKVVAVEEAEEARAKREAVSAFRRRMRIRIEGTGVPDPIPQFQDMDMDKQDLKKLLLHNIEKSEYKEPTAVQMQAIPAMLQNRDVLAIAPTGSGKTAAFAIPILAKLGKTQNSGIRAVVLSPTRELAIQIHAEFTRLIKGRKFRICLLSKATAATIASAGENLKVDLLIGTPLRLVHLIQQKSVDLSKVSVICLDEADRLFDMGFVEQIDEILAACSNPNIQRAMFSATMLQGVEEMAQSVLRDSVRVSIGTKNAGAGTIDQKLLFVGRERGKLEALTQIFKEGMRPPVLIFVQNKDRAKDLFDEIVYDGVNVGAIHADRTKEQRDETIRRFRTGDIWVLICTDLMSRGIDFKGVNLVVNYDFPQSAVSYIHRIGRTGRAGRSGKAVTFFTERDMQYLRSIANVMKISGCDVPQWMLSLKKSSTKTKKELLKKPPRRQQISDAAGARFKKKRKKHQGQYKKSNKSVSSRE